MGSAGSWNRVIDGLKDQHRCLAVDLPGHGASTGLTDEAYTMVGAAHALLEVLDAHGIDRCAVVGYSMGGRLALYFALHHPTRCNRLVLESASPGLETARARAVRRGVDEAHAIRLETDDFEALLHDWYEQPLFSSLARQGRLKRRLLEARRQNDPRELARSLRGMGTGQQPSLWERLGALRVSTLVVAGALDEKYVEIAERIARLSPAVRAAVVPDAGHNVHAERPHRFLALLRAFLEDPVE